MFVLTALLVITGIAVCICYAWDQWTERRLRAAAESDFEALEAYLGYSLPAALRQLYRNPDLIDTDGFDWIDPATGHAWEVAHFFPANVPTAKRYRFARLDGFPFAGNTDGDLYYVWRPDPVTGEQPVFLRKFSGEDVLVAPSVEALLAFQVREPEIEED